MYTLAPALRPLISILRSAGPVISTRRSDSSAGTAAMVQSPLRTAAVSGRKSGSLPASSSAWRFTLRSSKDRRTGSNLRASSAMKTSASGVRMLDCSGVTEAVMLMPAG